MAEPKNTKESAEKEAPKTAAKKGKKILIVEDEHPLAHALELKFTHEGYDVTIASDGESGLKLANSETFHMILLDLIMPKLDGFGFMEQLKKKVPVIVLSNLGQDEDKKRAEELGAKGYYVKSNTPISEIIKKVISLL